MGFRYKLRKFSGFYLRFLTFFWVFRCGIALLKASHWCDYFWYCLEINQLTLNGRNKQILLWNCTKMTRKLLWNCSVAVKSKQNHTKLKLHRHCSSIALKPLWNCSVTVNLGRIKRNPSFQIQALNFNFCRTALKLLWNRSEDWKWNRMTSVTSNQSSNCTGTAYKMSLFF